jgi:hypothetical protein
MLTDYKNLLIYFLPIFIGLYLLVIRFNLNPKIASLLIFILMTLPCIIILGTILYYHFSNIQPYDTKEDCKKYNYKQYGQGLCNVWDNDDNKCYKGLYDNEKNICNKDLIKNIPISIYIGCLFIIFANIFFHHL